MSLELPHKRIGVAVIWNQSGQILIDKRKLEGTMGGLWEFPGGKIEAGETVVDCIVREIREELAIDITVSEHLMSIEHTYKLLLKIKIISPSLSPIHQPFGNHQLQHCIKKK